LPAALFESLINFFQTRPLNQVFFCHHRQYIVWVSTLVTMRFIDFREIEFVSMHKNIIMERYYKQRNFIVNKKSINYCLILVCYQDTLFWTETKSAGEIMKNRVIIADDHAIIREGLKSLLEKKGMDVIAVAGNGREAIALAIKLQPSVIIMDISMPDLNGVEATATIRKKLPETKIIALSMHSSKLIVDKMFTSGATGYILKESAFDELYDAILEVNKGNFYLTPSIARMYVDDQGKMFEDIEDMSKSKEISGKERQVLQLVAEGEKTRDIAEKLGVSIKTVETHRRNMMKKLNIFSIAGLTKFAIKEGIVSLE